MATEESKAKQYKLAGLYEEYYDKIARYVYTRIGDKTEAEDIASEVFMKALESLKNYREKGLPMQAWLFKIAHNLVVDYLRKAAKHKIVSIDTIELVSEVNPQVAIETKVEIERVRQAMSSLTEDQREVIRLRFFAELTSQEVGSVLNKTDGAVREMQRAGLQKLRQILGVNTPG